VKKIFPIENIQTFFIQHYYVTNVDFQTTVQQIVDYAIYNKPIINTQNKKYTEHAANFSFPSCWMPVVAKKEEAMKTKIRNAFNKDMHN
jgi:hypothetical protein